MWQFKVTIKKIKKVTRHLSENFIFHLEDITHAEVNKEKDLGHSERTRDKYNLLPGK